MLPLSLLVARPTRSQSARFVLLYVQVEVHVSLTSERITRVLDQLMLVRGKPERLRADHGPEFTSGAFVAWCEGNGVALE